MKLRLYHVDTFTRKIFRGNPPAICPLDSFLPTETMQSIAFENNPPVTAFIVKCDGQYHIRWFTPSCELSLCGHATLAAAFIILNYYDTHAEDIQLQSKSGLLSVVKLKNGKIKLIFPIINVDAIEPDPKIVDALGAKPIAMYRSTQDYLTIYTRGVSVFVF